MSKITVILADDHAVVRQGLSALLEAEQDIEIVGEAENGREAVQMTRSLSPDVIVMDIALPLMNGLEATRRILKQAPSARVLLLSSYSDDEYVHHLVEEGVAGYLLKRAAVTDLVTAIREVKKGNAYFSSPISRRLLEHYRGTLLRGAPMRQRTTPLTSREAEVLQLIAEGKANKQIAPELGLSIHTVAKHRQRLMNKLGIHDIAGLTRYAVAKGIIKTSPAHESA